MDTNDSCSESGVTNHKDLEIILEDAKSSKIESPTTLFETSKTWVPDEQGAREDAVNLHKSLQGWINTSAIIDIISTSCNRRRCEIATQYHQLYKKELKDVLHAKLGGLFRRAVLMALMPLPEFYARELHCVLSRCTWRKDNILIVLLCTIDQEMLREVNKTYWKLYKMSLQFDLKRNTEGYFQRLLVQLSLNRRSLDTRVDYELAQADARDLLDAGEGRLGTDEATFNRILTTRSVPQLLRLFEEYENLTGHSIEKAIHREFSGKLQRGLLSLVRVVRDRSGYIALQLHDCMVGLGTKNDKLIRLIVTQSETDFPSVKKAFKLNYDISLADYIADDTSGDFRKFLLAVIGE